MEKLTSSEIDWKDGKNFAAVYFSNNEIHNQLVDMEMVNYSEIIFYIVEREEATEKQLKMIVDAVNAMRGEFDHASLESGSGNQIIIAMCDFDDYKEGEFATGNSCTSGEYWHVLCTIEEYSQCVAELAEAAWMNKLAVGEPQSYKAYKLYWSDKLISDEIEAHRENDAMKILKLSAAIELVHNVATESLDLESLGNLESSLRVLASNRNIEIEIAKGDQLGDEWRNGDHCVLVNDFIAYKYVGFGAVSKNLSVIMDSNQNTKVCYTSELSRPETAEQKASREREEKARELCKVRCESFGHRYNWDTLGEKKKEGYRNMIDKGVKLPE